MKKAVCLLAVMAMVIIVLSDPVKGQAPDSYYQDLIESALETLAEEKGEETDLSEISEHFQYLAENPLNLNRADIGQLEQLYFLNDFQVAMLAEYLAGKGPVLSHSELLYIPGFSEREVNLLREFTCCGERSPRNIPPGRLLHYTEHQLLIRAQRVMELQEGYKHIPDSILQGDPGRSRYLGSPEKVYLRYSLDAADRLQAGILMEKDAGEEFFRGSKRQGFDFYSGYLRIQTRKTVQTDLILGDYHVKTGQGLLLRSGYSFGKLVGIKSFSGKGSLISPYRSTDENLFFRGLAFTMKKGRFSHTLFMSLKRIDASVADSSIRDDAFTAFNTTGLHNTPLQLGKENQLGEKVYGMILHYGGNRFRAGINALYHRYSMTCLVQDELYRQFYFHGQSYAGISTDYSYLAGRFQLFGESAYSWKGLALLNGARLFLHQGLTLVAIYRDYARSYYSSWSNGLAESGRVNNEKGFLLGAETSFRESRISLYGDVFSFPWLRFGTNVPSEGYEVKVDGITKLGRMELSLHYKREEKPANYGKEGKITEIRDRIKEQYKLRLVWTPGNGISLQTRVECIESGFKGDTLVRGFFAGQDLVLQPVKMPFQLSTRIAWFSAKEWDARLYVYEKDLLYTGGSQMHYGCGWRYMGMIRWKMSDNFDLWLKVSQSIYPGKKETGSGLNRIERNHRTELKVQIKAEF